MRAKRYEYARQMWVCTLIESESYLKPCDIGGKCDQCEIANSEKLSDARARRAYEEAEG